MLPMSLYGLFFIITVELPDVESDTYGGKKNIVVNYGEKNAKIISLSATTTATLYFILMNYLELTNNEIYWIPFIVFSLIPFFASLISLLKNEKDHNDVIKQVMLNMVSLTIFLLLSIVNLFFQNIP